MRKVEYTIYGVVGYQKSKTTVNTGIFHEWGTNYEEFETGPGNFSAAIIENDEGEIVLVPAENVKFLTSNPELQ